MIRGLLKYHNPRSLSDGYFPKIYLHWIFYDSELEAKYKFNLIQILLAIGPNKVQDFVLDEIMKLLFGITRKEIQKKLFKEMAEVYRQLR